MIDRCKFAGQCPPSGQYITINPNTQLSLTGGCSANCDSVNSLTYKFNVYKKWVISPTDIQEKWCPFNNNSYYKGKTTLLFVLKVCNVFLEAFEKIKIYKYWQKVISICNPKKNVYSLKKS